MGPTPYYLKGQVVSANQVLSLQLHSFFRQKYHFWHFSSSEYKEGCGHMNIFKTT